MALNSAHTGYAYQDLLCAYFILEEVISENEGSIRIDQKEIQDDRFDDLVIRNTHGVFRKQIKYSDPGSERHTLSKDDLANDNGYNLALHSLFKSWQSYPEDERGELKLCLSWNRPNSDDDILGVLDQSDHSCFRTFKTDTFVVNINSLWRDGGTPLSSWRKFKSESTGIDRDQFQQFAQALSIEVNLPSASLNIYSPGELEVILLDQVRRLGVGEYPNNDITVQEVILALTQIVTNSRSRGIVLHTSQILNLLRIKTDFGRIDQVFPVDSTKLIRTESAINEVSKIISNNNKIIITGEPGAGKSWFVNNLEASLKKKFRFVKHYCYTDLKDDLQVERIKLNTLYGNLISEILEHFPELKKHKEKIWASNLNELNLLLSNVPDNLIIIIDGLDHVQRIYELKRNIVSKAEVDILNAIDKINLISKKVKIVVLSQPINEIQDFNNFIKIPLPKWSEKEVLGYMNNHKIVDYNLSEIQTLSGILTLKSAGNPLYLSYLIEELKNAKNFSIEMIDQLPPYSFNLSEYYQYILTKLNEGSIVPKIFAGVNFSLSKNELIEITGMGEYVDTDITAMLPVLNTNYATGGYSIYHESFRRFIIEKLIYNGVNIWQSIFKPIAEWLEYKGFFAFNKSSKFYFPLLYENNKGGEIAKYIHANFIKNCLYYGHSWGLIVNNFRYLTLSTSSSKSIDNLIILAEQSRILASVDVEYKETFGEYFKALGAIHSYEVAANLLVFEGTPTVEKTLGFTACRICEYYGVTAPWNLYINDGRKGTSIQLEEFADYLIYLLSNKKYKNLEHIAKQLNSENDYKFIFQNEIKKWVSHVGNGEWIENVPNTKKLLFPKRKKISLGDITTIRDCLLGIDFLREEIKNDIKIFFEGIANLGYAGNYIAIEDLIKPFYAKNWFYNWLIFYAKLKIVIAKTDSGIPFQFSELEEAFKYLIYDTEVFKGKIRTCDLYGIRNIIHQSIKEGLNCIEAEKERQKIIDLLQNVSHETTTTIQNSPGGPLIPSALLDILSDYDSEYQIDATIEKYEEELQSERLYRFYQSTSEYYFRLAVLYSKKGNNIKGDNCFKEGIQFLLSYTFRKDSTLGELIDSVSSLNSCSPELGLGYIRKLKILADTVVNHTDGRTTKWYPIHWFEEFYKISPRDSLVFLSYELFDTRYDWRLEDNLKYFLISTNGKINALIELLIIRTFPVADSKDFLQNAFDLAHKIKTENPTLSENCLKLFLTKIYTGNNTSYSDEFLEETERLSRSLNMVSKKSSKNQNEFLSKKNLRVEEVIKQNFHFDRSGFSEMSNVELIAYCEGDSIPGKDSQGLYFRLQQMEWGAEKREVISLLARKDRTLSDSNHKWAESLFQDDSKESIFFYISKFVYQHGGWFECFVNIEAFKKAYQLNAQLALDFLFEILPGLLSQPTFTHKFSANLINALTEVGYPSDKIITIWEVLYKIIDERIPGKTEYDWENEIPKELSIYSDEELLLILLISRLRSFSSERTHWTISGLKYLLTQNPRLLINPIKWFLKNTDKFLEINLLLVLQLLYEHHLVDHDFSTEFKTELLDIYPTNYFLIDWIIEQLANLEPREKLFEPAIICKPSKQFVKLFRSLNLRHYQLERMGFDLESVFGQYENSFKSQYKDSHELYYSRVNKVFVSNLYSPNYILKLINEKLYNDFREFESFYGSEVYRLLRVKDKELISQYLSTSSRPLNLKKPSDLEVSELSCDITITDGWVRLGLLEQEYYQEKFLEDFTVRKTFGGVIFSDIGSHALPCSNLILNFDMYNSKDVRRLPDFDGYSVLFDLHTDDMAEPLKLIWLHPMLFSTLNLKMSNLEDGIYALDSKGEIVLKYNAWRENYMGDSFNDEIPKLDGSELLIREDYFVKLCSIYSDLKPKFILVSV